MEITDKFVIKIMIVLFALYLLVATIIFLDLYNYYSTTGYSAGKFLLENIVLIIEILMFGIVILIFRVKIHEMIKGVLVNHIQNPFKVWRWIGEILIVLIIFRAIIGFVTTAGLEFPIYFIISTVGLLIISYLFILSGSSNITPIRRLQISIVNVFLSLASLILNAYFISIEGHFYHTNSYFAFIFIIPAFICCTQQIHHKYRNENMSPPPDEPVRSGLEEFPHERGRR